MKINNLIVEFYICFVVKLIVRNNSSHSQKIDYLITLINRGNYGKIKEKHIR